MFEAKYIQFSRLIFVGILRAVALLWGGYNVVLFVSYVIIYEFDNNYTNGSMGSVFDNWTIMVSVLLQILAGLALWIFAPVLSIRCFRYSPPKCPNCLFLFENFKSDRCPECGLYLGQDFHAPPAPAPKETPGG